MPTLMNNVVGFQAACKVTAQVGPVFTINKGFTSTGVLRNGAGDYTLTLLPDGGINLDTEAMVLAEQSANLAGSITVEPLTTTTLRVRTSDAAGAAAERNFWLTVIRA